MCIIIKGLKSQETNIDIFLHFKYLNERFIDCKI